MPPRRLQFQPMSQPPPQKVPPSQSSLQEHSQLPSEHSVESNSSIPSQGTPTATTNEFATRNGRGPAVGVKGWGTPGYKMHLTFNEHMQVCGTNSKPFSTRLGICGVKLPLYHLNWHKVCVKKKEAIWKEVQEYTNAPDEFKHLCLMHVGDLWRAWKSTVKKKFYTPNKYNSDVLSTPPTDTRVRDSDWKKLVEHWKNEDVEEEAEWNKKNREQFEFPLRTGRTSFADIRLEMMENGEDTSRQNVFRKTRTKKNGGVTEEVDAALMDRKLSEVPESERTPEFID